MITRLSHTTIYVDDHDKALDFYVGKLGFDKRSDMTMEGFRWLSVSPPGQDNLEIVLMLLQPSPMMDESTVQELHSLMTRGALGSGVFAVDDCHGTYAELRAQGVEFMSEPTQRPYGIEAILKDPFGNWFSMTQRGEGM